MNIFSKTLKVLAVVGAFSFLLASCSCGGVSSDAPQETGSSGSTEWKLSYSTAYGTAPASKNVADGYKLIAADLPTLSKDGYEFKGWDKAVGFEVKADTTITASWNASKYIVTFDENGGSGTMESQEFTFNVPKELSENTFTPPVGFKFTGWSTTADGSSEYSDKGEFTIGAADTTLYAVWIEKDALAITYNLDGGTNDATNPSSFRESETVTLSEPTRSNYTFKGWYTDSSFTEPAISGWAAGDKTANVELYAKWETVSYTITYNLNSGTNAASNPASFTVEDTVTLADPTRTDYTFKGWYTTSDYSGTAISGWSAGDKTSEVELFAKWEAVSYTITYNLNSGTNATSNPASFTVEDTVTLANPTRPNYNFKGWYTNSSLTGSAISGWSAGDKTANIILYAKWDTALYSITYSLNSGTNAASNPATFTAMDSVTLAAPTRTDYTFKGWYTNPSFTGTAISGWSAGNRSANITLYAKWDWDYARLKTGTSWFNTNAAAKDTITKITFQTEPYTGSSTTSWDAGVNTGEITAYLKGTEVIVSSNGKKMRANKSCRQMFYKFENVTSINLSCIDTRDVTDMNAMFWLCTSLTDLDISRFDTSNVTNMNGMFYYCKNLISINVSRFDTHNVTNMAEMFTACSKLASIDVSGFDTHNVTNMYEMFYGAKNLITIDVSSFDTSNVTNMEGMLCCGKLKRIDLSNFDTRKVTNMSNMFRYCFELEKIYVNPSKFVTSQVTDSTNMFIGCNKLSGAIAFNSSKLDKAYANTTTGYFTAK